MKRKNKQKRPSIFRQAKFDLGDQPDPIQQSITTLKTGNTLRTINSISTASNSLCSSKNSSISSTKHSLNRKCSVDSNQLGEDLEEIERIQYGVSDKSKSTKKVLFKTENCKFWQSGKPCPYQNNCLFAHGENEKRQKVSLLSSSSYKTKICKNYFEKGECSYGKRCNFLHHKIPYQRDRQFYRRRMGQIHKDPSFFNLNAIRLDTFRDIQSGQISEYLSSVLFEEDKENSETPPSSKNNITESSNSSSSSLGSFRKFKNEKSLMNFTAAENSSKTPQGRHLSIRV